MKIDYKNKRLLSPSEQESKEVDYLVESARLQFEADLLETRRGLEESKAKLSDLKTEHPLDVKSIIEAEIEVEAYQDGINRLNKLGQELGFING
jgi:hypothetical protein